MSSIVSRRPPFSVSVSHANERRWISIRFGTSRGLFRRAKLRRVRGESTEAKRRRLLGYRRRPRTGGRARPKSATHKDSTRQRHPLPTGQPALTDPAPGSPRMWRGTPVGGGCDYWPIGGL